MNWLEVCLLLLSCISGRAQAVPEGLGPAAPRRLSLVFESTELVAPPRVEIPARVVNGLLVVQAEVDGRAGAFFFDSGAPALLLNRREFGPAAGDDTLLAQRAHGVNGTIAGFSSYVAERFNFQGIILKHKEIPTFDMARLEARLGGEKLLGLIGYNLLSHYAVTLDYRAGQVLLQQPTTASTTLGAGKRVPFVLRGHLPVVEATIEGHTYALGLDTGAQTNLLDPAAGAALGHKLRHRERVTLYGADAAGRTATTAIIPHLALGGGRVLFKRQETTFADVSHLSRSLATVPLQGLLGYPLLSQYRTTIDYVNREVRFEKW